MMNTIEIQPVLDAIEASLQAGAYRIRGNVAVTLPTPEGGTLVVTIRRAPRIARSLDERQLARVHGAIEEKIAEPITVTMLSSAAGLSRSHFSHAFRRSVGRTPHQYVMGLRIERALRMMADTDLQLCEIALATGFCDQAHFTNAFRRAMGVTPTEWRRGTARKAP